MFIKCVFYINEDFVWFCYLCEKLICEKCRKEYLSYFVEEIDFLFKGLLFRLLFIIE